LSSLAVFCHLRPCRKPGVLRNEFLRYKNVPGLAIGHPAIVYDNVTDL